MLRLLFRNTLHFWFTVLALFLGGLLSLFLAHPLRAQVWRQIGNLPAGSDLRCAYFWDPNHGVVGGANCIYTYTNGLWAQASYPEPPDTIKSLRLLDGVNLYAASGATCIWKSVDRGATWQKTAALLQKADDIYMTSDGQIHGVNIHGIGMMRGTSVAQLNASNYAVARDDENSPVYSSDAGLNWSVGSPPNMDCGYNCVVDTCTDILYTLSDGTKAELYVSPDGGRSWGEIYDFSSSSRDIIEGANSDVIYVQGTNEVYRLTTGQVWTSIGGPGSPLEDRRMFTFGTNNRYLVDMVGGAVWFWDGGLNYPGTLLVESARITPPGCGANFTQLFVQWDGPEDTMVVHAFSKDNAEIIPADTTLVLSPNGNYTILYYTPFPAGTTHETFYFNDTAWRTRCPDVSIVKDTEFTVTIRPEVPRVKLQDTLKLTYCLTAKLPLTITPSSCDSLWIDSIHCSAPVGSYAVLGTVPALIPDGTTDTFSIAVADLAPGTYNLSVHIAGSSLSTGGRYDTTLTVVLVIAGSGIPSSISVTPIVKKASCTPARMPIVIKTSICDSIWIDSLQCSDDTSGTYALAGMVPILIPPGSVDTVWVALSQGAPGHYTTYATLFGHSTIFDSWLDTTFLLVTTVNPNPKTPRVIAKNVTVSNCKESAVPIVLDALPCDSVDFTYGKISISGGATFTNSFAAPVMVPAGGSDTVWLTFAPDGLMGTYVVTAEFRGIYEGSTDVFDTTVFLRITFTNSGYALVANANPIVLEPFSICDAPDTIATFKNVGCDTIILTSNATIWQSGWSGTYPTLPDTLPPDSSFVVQVHYQPFDTSYQTEDISFDYRSGAISGTIHTSLAAEALSVDASIAIDHASLGFGTFERCHTMTADSTITLTNTSCDSLRISNIAVDAGSGFTLTMGGDTTLARNESATYRIHFSDSVVNDDASLFHCTGTNVHGGTAVDSSVPLSAKIVAGTRSATISPTAIDFGRTTVCEERDSVVTIANTGCEADTIYGYRVSSKAFTVDSAISFPIVLLPNSSARFPVVTDLDTAGEPDSDTGTLAFAMDSASQVASVSLRRAITYPSRFALWLSATPKSLAGKMDTVFVHRTGTISKPIQEVDFDLIYNDDLLGYQTKFEPDIAMTASARLPNGLTDRSFALRPASDRDTIATLQFQTYLTKNETTSIALANQQFSVDGTDAAACIASIDTGSIPSAFQLELSCGDSTILAAWNAALPFRIDAIVPNPASNTISVSGEGLNEAGMNITLLDVLGAQLTMPEPLQLAGNVTFDLSSIPSGSYYLRFFHNGYTITRNVRIER